MEADYVIVPNLAKGTYGFPSQITDDPVLDIVMTSPDPYPHAEERRLFYVALRARRHVTLITERGGSAFAVELLDGGGVEVAATDGPAAAVQLCSSCGLGTMVSRTGPDEAFLGCSRFPACRLLHAASAGRRDNQPKRRECVGTAEYIKSPGRCAETLKMNAPASTIAGIATAGWHADPWQRHQYRWFDRQNWTATVANNGVQTEDSGGVAAPAPALPALPYAHAAPPQQQTPVVPVGYHQLPSKAPRRLGRSLAKGLFTVVCLLIVVVAVIAVINPSDDEELQASASEAFTVPVLLGADVTHNEVVVDSTMFGEDWPLTVDSGTVVCEAVPAPLELLNVFFVDTARARSTRSTAQRWAPSPRTDGSTSTYLEARSDHRLPGRHQPDHRCRA